MIDQSNYLILNALLPLFTSYSLRTSPEGWTSNSPGPIRDYKQYLDDNPGGVDF